MKQLVPPREEERIRGFLEGPAPHSPARVFRDAHKLLYYIEQQNQQIERYEDYLRDHAGSLLSDHYGHCEPCRAGMPCPVFDPLRRFLEELES